MAVDPVGSKLRSDHVKLSRLKTSLAIVLLVAVACVAYEMSRSKSDDDRYAEFLSLRKSFHRAASSRSGLIDRAAAVTHGSKPLAYFQQRYEDRRQELLKSGYFVHLAVPVSNLNARVIPITASLEDTARRTGFYYEVLMGFHLNEVRLVCRKQDVPLWEAAVKAGANR
jgi:hypothetical protein